MKKLGSFLLATLIAFSLTSVATPSRGAENETGISRVILIGVDGGGAFFREADTPNMDRIFKNGAVSYTVVTSNPTISAQCWGSMLHGVTPEFHGLTNGIVSNTPYPNDSPFPSIFRVIHENRPEAKLASFCHWNPVNIGIIEDNIGVVKDSAGNDAAVTDLACAYLEKNDPTFLFVHFDDCDGAGHKYGYGGPEHLAQLKTTDAYVQKIYETCEKKGILDDTLIIVTADHGGSGKSHGGWSDGEKYIMFAAVGPSVESGTIGEMGVRDTSSVVLYALGLADKQPESWTSRVPSGLFKGVTAGERPVYEVKYAYEHRTHESSPTPNGANSIPEVLGKERVLAYLPLDGEAKDALGKVQTKENGKLYFVDGYFGRGAQFDDGCVSLLNVKPGKSSFSVALWFKTRDVNGDPALLSNKNWNNGKLPGFVLSLRASDVKFNFGNGSARMDVENRLPIDFRDGWVHAILVVDREANEIRFSYDFKNFTSTKIPEALTDASLDSDLVLNIGQDGTGRYKSSLTAVLDDVLIIDGVLTEQDVATLKEAYQVK